MKTLLPLLAIVLLMPACSSMDYGYSNGSSSFGYSYSSGYSPALHTLPRRNYHCYQEPIVYVQGPQYYRSRVPYYGQNVKNYTDAPIVMPTYNCKGQQRTSRIIPASWD
jgi:hypothetical protein